MRKGLHPLAVHLGMAAAKTEAMQEYVSSFKHDYSQEQLIEMMRGIKLYQDHIYEPCRLETKEIWRSGSVRILEPVMQGDCSGVSNIKPLLLVPSLINKSYILDLSEQRSMLRWFRKNGVNAYLLDWGDLVNDKTSRDIDMNELIEVKLCGAIKALSENNSQQIDVLGYCMGGTLLVAAYGLASDFINRMIFLAVPWDFSVRSSKNINSLSGAVRLWSPLVLPLIREKGFLPSSYVQALFASLGEGETVRKFIKFASMDQKSDEANFFVSVEDWLNDDVDIPKNIAISSIEDWFIKNATFNKEWIICNRRIDAADIKSDILIVASFSDCLVPYNCAMALKDQITMAKCNVIEPKIGHIGLIVGNRAVDEVWTPMLEWLKS